MPMKILQTLPSLRRGDAVGNDAMAINRALLKMGYDAELYALDIQASCQREARPYQKMKLRKEDILLYHNAAGSKLTDDFAETPCRKIMIYHNITPPQFFRGYSIHGETMTKEGLEQTRRIADKVEYCLAVSEFNKQDLRRMGYTCPIDVRPILIPFSDYEQEPSKKILKRYEGDGYTNILFVGRIAPNKKYEDLIRVFYYYKRINPKSRLILVGNPLGFERYDESLKQYAKELGLDDIIFTGGVPFQEILAYYHLADAFLCMSEHEGFCVPLVEAMFFHVPIFAYDSTAIPSTLGGSGVLLEEKNPIFVAKVMQRVLEDERLKEQVVKGQQERLEDFSYERIYAQLEKCMHRFIQGEIK